VEQAEAKICTLSFFPFGRSKFSAYPFKHKEGGLMEQAEFEAQITNINIKRDVTMDKRGVLKLEFLPTEELVDKLNKLMKVDSEVKVIINEI